MRSRQGNMLKNLRIKASFAVIICIAVIFLPARLSEFSHGDDPNYIPKNYTALVGNSENPYSILIDVEVSTLYLLKDGAFLKSFPCSGGAASTPSPIGTWTIISKDTWYEGFGGRWMGFNVPWGKFGIHGTIEPWDIGYATSHGCIRMYNDDVAELYDIVPYGTKVTIVDGPYGDFGQGFRTLRSGMYGSDVLAVQKRLKELGFYGGYASGHFDSDGFISAVMRWQESEGLPQTGVLTPSMIEKLGFVLME
jgi:hypothetical protein